MPTLERLIESEHELAAAVSQPDRPAGRGRALRAPPAKELASRHSDPRAAAGASEQRGRARLRCERSRPDAIVIAAYGQILKQALLDIPKRGSLNVHASLLPRWRGAAPAAGAILAGDERTGVSIQEIVLALDAGPVLAQRELPIADDDTTGSLNEKLSRLGADLIIEALPAWERGDIEAAAAGRRSRDVRAVDQTRGRGDRLVAARHRYLAARASVQPVAGRLHIARRRDATHLGGAIPSTMSRTWSRGPSSRRATGSACAAAAGRSPSCERSAPASERCRARSCYAARAGCLGSGWAPPRVRFQPDPGSES